MPPDSTTCFNTYTNKYCIHQNHFLLVLLASTKFTTKLVNILSLTTLSLSLTFGFPTSGVWSLLTHSGGEEGIPPGWQRHHYSQKCHVASRPCQLCSLFLPTFLHKSTLRGNSHSWDTTYPLHGSWVAKPDRTVCDLHGHGLWTRRSFCHLPWHPSSATRCCC